MAYTVKTTDKNTGKIRYRGKAKYSNKVEGIKWETTTGYYDNKDDALKEAISRLEAYKLGLSQQKQTKSTLQVLTLLNRYREKLIKDCEAITTQHLPTSTLKRITTIINQKHMYLPEDVAKCRVKGFKYPQIRVWIKYINDHCTNGNYFHSLKSAVMSFLDYLTDLGYFPEPSELEDIKSNISKMNGLLKKNENKRERYCPSADDIDLMIAQLDLSKGRYEDYYWWVLIYVLFWSGMRPEEIIGLRWKYIDFNNNQIKIRLAINDDDSPEVVKLLVQKDIVRLKNNESERTIKMLSNYNELLRVFKETTALVTGDINDPEAFNEDFVFSNMIFNPKATRPCLNTKMILNHIDSLSSKAGIPKTDTQMIRHGCATHLILSGWKYDECFRYFGHGSSDMLRNIYGKLKEEQNLILIEQKMIKEGLIDEKMRSKTSTEMIDKITARNNRIKTGQNKIKMQTIKLEGQINNHIDDKIKKGRAHKRSIFFIAKEERETYDLMCKNGNEVIERAKNNNVFFRFLVNQI